MTYKPLPQPTKPTKEVIEYVNAYSKGGRLVVPNGKGWHVVGSNNQKSSTFSDKKSAIIKAKKELAGTDSKVFVFDKAGCLTETLFPR